MCGSPKAGSSEFLILKLVYTESSAICQSQFKVILLGLSPVVGFCTWYAVILCIDLSSQYWGDNNLPCNLTSFMCLRKFDFQFVQFFFFFEDESVLPRA